MVWRAFVSVPFVELDAGLHSGGARVVWATAEENGLVGYRWSLSLDGRPFTIRGSEPRGADAPILYTAIGDDWARGDCAPLRATPAGNESYSVEYPFYRSTHMASATGRTRMVFYPRTMVVRESTLGLGVDLHDTNATATDTSFFSAARPPDVEARDASGMVAVTEPAEAAARVAAPITARGFVLRYDDAGDVAELREILVAARRSGRVLLSRWRLERVDPEWSFDSFTVANAAALDFGLDDLLDTSVSFRRIPRDEAYEAGASMLAVTYGGRDVMHERDAVAGARLFVDALDSASRFFLVETYERRVLIGVDESAGGLLGVDDETFDPRD